MNLPGSIEKYGLIWTIKADGTLAQAHLQIELAMIQNWGLVVKENSRHGLGLAHHIIEAQKLLWPDKGWHRWNKDLIIPSIAKGGTTAVFGPASAAKTHEVSDFFLTLYFANPRGFTCICSTTTTDMLDFRIFGQMKMRWKEAKERFSWLPGHVVGSKHMIVTDTGQAEDRDFRDGIKGVACVQGGVWKGLGNYVGIKNLIVALASDECFPAGTLVDTPRGRLSIESIQTGDSVICAGGVGRVLATSKRCAKTLVKIRARDGREIICTPNHPFLTQKGWKKACELGQEHYMLSAYEAMRILRDGAEVKNRQSRKSQSVRSLPNKEVPVLSGRVCSWADRQQTAVLHAVLQNEMELFPTGVSSKVLHETTREKHFDSEETLVSCSSGSQSSRVRSNVLQQPIQDTRRQSCDFTETAGNWMEAASAWRKRNGADESRVKAAGTVSRSEVELRDQDRAEEWQRLSNLLQGGLGDARSETSHRGRRGVARTNRAAESGFEEGEIPSGAWVDRVEVQEPQDFGRSGGSENGVDVYNLQVEGHPSYSVNGFLVHNCALMEHGFLKAAANLKSNRRFFGVYTGNLSDLDNPLAEAAEPELGWDSLPDTDKSRIYKTKYLNGRAVQLVGTDSPNFDYPAGREPFPYLIGREKIAELAHDYGTDTPLYNMYAKGKIPRDTMENRVITELVCKKFEAYEPVTWGDGELKKLYCADISYTIEHGDRTVGMALQFGRDVRGNWKIALIEPPLTYSLDKQSGTAEEQIAMKMRSECERLGIPPENVFFDGTGRSSFTSALMRLWSTKVNAVEFGGPATNRLNFIGRKYKDNNEKKGAKKGELMPCNEVFGKLVTEFWFAWRYAVEADQVRQLTDTIVKDGHRRIWYLTPGNKMDVEPKKDMKERTGRSPDLADGYCVGLEGARRLGFPLGKLEAKNETPASQWQLSAAQKWETMARGKELVLT